MRRSEDLRSIAVAIVGQMGTCPPNVLVTRLRQEFGASTPEANRTMLELIRDRHLARTAVGQLTLPGGRAGGRRAAGGGGAPVTMKAIGTILIIAIAAFIAWVVYQMATADRGPPPGFGPGGLDALRLLVPKAWPF